MVEAHHGYLRWGATAKASALVERHPDMLAVEGPVKARPDAETTATITGNDTVWRIDTAAMVRVAQAIIGEMVFEKLLERVMRIVVENAGADRGVLLLAR